MFFVSTMMAQQVSVSEALSRATSFLQSQSSSSKASAKVGTLTSSDLKLAYTQHRLKDQKVCFYVFNRGANATSTTDGNGFIIVGGDESAQQILGYSNNGTFDYDKIPDNFKWWLSQYQQQISAAIDYAAANPQAVTSAKAKAARKAASDREDVASLIRTKWDQGTPYNNAIKTASGYEFLTGCVATATAQVMKYHEWPTQGTGSYSPTLTCNANGTTTKFNPTINFGETTYKWSKMRDSQSDLTKNSYESYSTDEADAVATLMYHVGVAVDMKYGTAESGAAIAYIPKALTTYFGYDKSIRYEQRSYYSDDDWENMVYTELAAGRPAIYGGQDPNGGGGHCFVCDGYRTSDGFFSFNWGWGAYCDGYFSMTGTGALKPKGSGSGGAGINAEYTVSQEIVIGIRRNIGGSETINFTSDSDNYLAESSTSTTKLTSYTYDASAGAKTIYLIADLNNCCVSKNNFDYGVKATGKTSGETFYWKCFTQELSVGYGFNEVDLAMSLSKLTTDDTYTIVPVVRAAGGTDADWVEVKSLPSQAELTVVVSNNSSRPTEALNFTKAPYFNNDNNPYSKDLVLYFSVGNSGSSSETGNLKLKLDSYSIDCGSVTVNAGVTGSYSTDLSSLASILTAGNTYTLYFYRDDKNTPWNYESINFTYRDEVDDIELSIGDAGYATLILPFDAAIPTTDASSNTLDWKAYECNSMDGSTLVLTEATTLKRNTPYIFSGSIQGSVTFAGPEAIDASPVLFGDGPLKGTMLDDKYYFKTGDYILQQHGDNVAFYKYSGTGSDWAASPYRAFVQVSDKNAGLSYVSIPNDDVVTGINATETTSRPAGIYSADGVKRQTLQPGLNIVIDEQGNTRKMFIKK